MSDQRRFATEWDELGKIDFLLDQIARSVERGEVPRSVYDSLAPRYLQRRAALVATLSGRPVSYAPTAQPAAAQPAAAHPAAAYPAAVYPPAAYPAAVYPPAAYPPPAMRPGAPAPVAARGATPKVARKPVAWTTVLLFLGAFLVVVASAIFAVAVWDWLSAAGKLAFLGAVTAGFYAAGWWARTKLELPSGGVVLTAVASALLLFDGWILIDGYNLQGPLPWALVLLGCSVVYWFTEVRLESGFFGITGAAAQVGWWWLLGEGLGWPAPARLAGLALVALVWQVAAMRAADAPPFSSLARVLSWAAPVVAAGTALGIIVDLAWIGTVDPGQLMSAAVVSFAAGIVLYLTDVLPQPLRRFAAAGAQLPLLMSLGVAASSGNPGGSADSVWLAVAFGVAALVYAIVALGLLGWPFAVAELLCEFGMVVTLLRVFDASDNVFVVVLAALGALWAAAARVASTGKRADASASLRETGLSAEIASTIVLAGSSLAAVVVAYDGPLERFVWTLVAVLVAWCAATVVRWRLQLVAGTALWSLYVAAALTDHYIADARFTHLAIAVVLVGGAWLLSARTTVERRFGPVWAGGFRSVARALLVFFWMAATVSEFMIALFEGERILGTWPMTLLAASVSLVFLADAVLRHIASNTPTENPSRESAPPSGASAADGHSWRLQHLQADLRLQLTVPAFSAAVAVAAASFAARSAAGAAMTGVHLGLEYPALLPVLAGGITAVVLGMVSIPLAHNHHRLAQGVAIGACLGAALALAGSGGPAAVWAAGLGLLAIALMVAAVTVSQAVYGVAGAVAVFAVWQLLAWLEPAAAVTAGVLIVTGFAIALPSFVSALRPGHPYALAGSSLAVAGLFAHATLALTALSTVDASAPAWLDLGYHGLASALVAGGALVLAQAVFRRLEPALYVGWALLLAAALVEMHALDLQQGELYTTALALYLIAMGYLYAYMESGREFPVALDAAAVAVGLGMPLLWSLGAVGTDALVHAIWVVALALVAMAAGFLSRSRWLFFGGAVSLAAVALYRSFSALAEFWWVWLGLLGIAMLVIALTWERQRLAITDARERMRLRFEGWR